MKKAFTWIIRIALQFSYWLFQAWQALSKCSFRRWEQVNTLILPKILSNPANPSGDPWTTTRDDTTVTWEVQRQALIMSIMRTWVFRKLPTPPEQVASIQHWVECAYALINLRKQFSQRTPQYDKNFYLWRCGSLQHLFGNNRQRKWTYPGSACAWTTIDVLLPGLNELAGKWTESASNLQ